MKPQGRIPQPGDILVYTNSVKASMDPFMQGTWRKQDQRIFKYGEQLTVLSSRVTPSQVSMGDMIVMVTILRAEGIILEIEHDEYDLKFIEDCPDLEVLKKNQLKDMTDMLEKLKALARADPVGFPFNKPRP